MRHFLIAAGLGLSLLTAGGIASSASARPVETHARVDHRVITPRNHDYRPAHYERERHGQHRPLPRWHHYSHHDSHGIYGRR